MIKGYTQVLFINIISLDISGDQNHWFGGLICEEIVVQK